MASENPLAGVGAGRWNRYKNEYSTDEVIPKVLLDSHNDYLALIAQYGILCGIILAWVAFFYPFYLYFKRDIRNYGALSYLFVINFAMGVAAISNAGFFKHQVSALLLLSLCITHKLYLEKGNG
jgi:O-antigen ligase